MAPVDLSLMVVVEHVPPLDSSEFAFSSLAAGSRCRSMVFVYVYSRDGALRNANGSLCVANTEMGVTKSLLSRGLAGERHVSSLDAEIRRLYSYQQETQREWAAAGYDPDFVGDPMMVRGPTPQRGHW